MAPGSDTWRNSAGIDKGKWDVAGNWLGGDIPGDTHTATFDGEEVEAGWPTSNQPAAGTIHFVFTGAYNMATPEETIHDDILGAAGAAIGNITINGGGSFIVPGANFGGGATGCTVADGELYITSNCTCTGDIIALAGEMDDLSIHTATLTVAGGTVEMQAETKMVAYRSMLDLAEPMRIVGEGNHTIEIRESDIQGGIDASSDGTARQVTAIGTLADGSEVLQLDVAGDLDLGTDGAGGVADWSDFQVNTAAGCDQTFRADANVYGFDHVAGALTGGDHTVTVAAGGLSRTAGTLDAAGTLNVTMTGTGGLSWASAFTSRLGTVTFSGDTTVDGHLYCQAVAGDGAITVDGSRTLYLYPAAANFWTLSTESDGWTLVRIRLDTSRANATHINVGSSPVAQSKYATTLTLTGGLTCGTVTHACETAAATLDMNGGNLTCTDFKFDEDDGAFLAGSGTHVIAGVIERLTGDETGCSIDFESSHTTFGGDMTLAAIAVDFGSHLIVGSAGTETINAASATSLTDSGAQIRNCTLSNFADYGVRRLRVRCVIEGANMAKRLLHLDYPRHRVGRFRRKDSARL